MKEEDFLANAHAAIAPILVITFRLYSILLYSILSAQRHCLCHREPLRELRTRRSPVTFESKPSPAVKSSCRRHGDGLNAAHWLVRVR